MAPIVGRQLVTFTHGLWNTGGWGCRPVQEYSITVPPSNDIAEHSYAASFRVTIETFIILANDFQYDL